MFHYSSQQTGLRTGSLLQQAVLPSAIGPWWAYTEGKKPCTLKRSLEISRRCLPLRRSRMCHSHLIASQRSAVPRPAVNQKQVNNSIDASSAVPISTVDNDVITLYYKSGWSKVILHGSVKGGAWQDYKFSKVRDDLWKVDVDVKTEQPSYGVPLEFVVKDGSGTGWDKMPDGTNYQITTRGSHILYEGQINPTTGKRLMLVSDLDDTMIGNDQATATFKKYWERGPALLGGKLVYNTGRHLEKYKDLYEDKSGCMAHPDVLICSVGTRVYEWKGRKFLLDEEWTGCLDAGWDYEIVKETMMQLKCKVNDDQLLKFNDKEEQNGHKCTCMISIDILPEIQRQVEEELSSAGVKFKFISSGKGAHRFVDIIPEAAGKLPALEHVRKKYGFDASQVVACGDSGNDKDMLAGFNLAIVVGNAHDDLKQWAEGIFQEQVERNGTRPRMFLANKERAFGILEGLNAFGFITLY